MGERWWEGEVPSEVNDLLVSPSPWRRMRTLTAEPEDGGTMSRVREVGKSDFVGSLGMAAISSSISEYQNLNLAPTCPFQTCPPEKERR